MITRQLINPDSIVVIGGSNDVSKPGGKVLKNLIDGNYKGSLYVTNLKEDNVQGITCFKDPADLPSADLAIIAIAARYVPETVRVLATQKNTKAFIILSAGFSEENEAGAKLEKEVVDIINDVGGTLIGPNCVGILTPQHHSIFTYPIPGLSSKGCDFISGSGATACFIMEAGIPKGLTFSNVFSVGNSAQTGVEEILQYLDETYDPETSSSVKLLYLETISKPDMLLKHAASLINKGCKIAAIKAGSSDAGSRAASSHTGALATPDAAVDALFRKAGIVRCYGREELISVASVFMHPPLKGKNIAVITHAGGPAVMLTDALSSAGLEVPSIDPQKSNGLLSQLYPGSSVANPIDFLATGTAEQLGTIIDYAENTFHNIDGMVVIFGTPGLFPVFSVYDVLHKKMLQCRKPIFPVLPSILTAHEEIEEFISKGHVFFSDEVSLGNALGKINNTPPPADHTKNEEWQPTIDLKTIRNVVQNVPDGYLEPDDVQALLDAVNIPRAGEAIATSATEAVLFAKQLRFPIVMKVIGPVHKSDVGGVVLDIKDEQQVRKEFERMIKLKDTTGILLQPMLSGIELFVGAKYEENFGHMIFCGMGGIFIEVIKDVSSVLTPVSKSEAIEMIKRLKSYKILEGIRGKEGIDIELYAEILVRLSALLQAAPEISEMDLNPLLGIKNQIVAVDARIKITHHH
jgi:acetate---CoA ligase (ADP-forming)